MTNKAMALSQLARQVKASLSAGFTTAVWVVAEIQEMNMHRTGHCYMELVEKDPTTDKLLAKIRATIWASSFRILRPYFETTTGYQLSSGMKVMFSVAVEFHEVFGFSLNIRDLDPSYTMGDIARKRQETIARLRDEGVYELNKELELPAAPRFIAVISSAGAAGFGDFMSQLHNNERGYVFYTTHFEATMQGDTAADSIAEALERVYEYEELFDTVVIIRGGGSKSDLAAFDEYSLASNIAQFPMPVLTGIGHDRDESVADLVAHRALKTPTAVAEFLISCIDPWAERFDECEAELRIESLAYIQRLRQQLDHVSVRLMPLVQSRLQFEKERVQKHHYHLQQASLAFLQRENLRQQKAGYRLQQVTNTVLAQKKFDLKQLETQLKQTSLSFLNQKKQQTENLEKTLQHLDPVNTLKRGFSVTFIDGKLLRSTAKAKKGSIIVTRLTDGEIESTVQ